jgi:F-type H+-transporting ATPase subunit b
MSGLFQDPMFFYSIAFVIFLALAWRYGRKPMLGWLDSEILKIRNELEQARKLRAEAEAMLAQYKAKQAEAMKDAEAIVRHASEEAARLRAQAAADLKDALAKHEQQAATRIRLAEAEAIADVRTAVVDLAMKLARETLAAKLDDATAAKLTEQAIAEIPKLAKTKTKAA